MNIIFNHDGSIKNLNLNEIIVQGNNLVNEIQIAIEGRTPDDYVATAYFTLPDGSSNYLTGSADNFSIDQTPYSGYSINLTSAQTVMAGEVGMTIQCTDANSHVLCTYKVKLTINESGYIPEATTITMAQYASIIASLSTFQQKFVTSNARYYPSYDDAEEDLGNLATNQLAIVGGDSTPLAFYFKNGSGNLQKISTEFFGYIELSGTDGTLTSAQIRELQKDFCIINHEGTYFFKTEDAYAFEQEYIVFRTIPFFDSSDLIYADKKQQTINVYPEDGYEWGLTEKDIYEGIVFQATELETEEAITSIDEFLAECVSYNADFSANDGHRYHYSYTNPITHNTTDYFAEFLGGDYSALVRVRSMVGAVNQTDKVYYCFYNTSSSEWVINEIASKAYVDEEAIGYFEIADSTDDRSGTLTSQQKGQAKKDFCVIKYTDSNGIPMYFINLYDYDTSNPSSRAFHCIEGWRNSSDEGISQEFREATIVIEDLDEGLTAGWELNTTVTKVDEEPTEDSYNLVTSGGVYDAIASAKSTIEGEISTAISGVQDEISSLTRTLIHKDDYSTLSTSFDAYGVAPKAFPKASLDGFLGNSVVRNQLVQNGNFASNSGWNAESGVTLSVSSNVATIVSTTAGNGINRSINIVSGRKYILAFTAKSSDSLTIKIGGSYDTGTQKSQVLTSSFVTYYAIVTASGSGSTFYIFSTTTGTFDIKQVVLIDLTQWFGSNDLIPADLLSTPSLFLSKYAYGMDLSFNTGTLVDGTLTKLKANSFNVWDEETEVNDYLYSKNFINVIPNADYYFAYTGNNAQVSTFYLLEYDKDKNLLDGFSATGNTIGGINIVYRLRPECCYVKFRMQSYYGTTYKHDICINLSSSMNGTYLPHASPIETPLSIGTLRSAGSVRDTNELTKVIRKNLGELDWYYNSANEYFYSFGLQDTIKPAASNTSKANAIWGGGYNNGTWGSVTGGTNMDVCVSTNGSIALKNTSYTDPTTLKEALNGVYANFELATPTARTTTFPELLDIHSGGVIEAEFADLPATTQITYLEEE